MVENGKIGKNGQSGRTEINWRRRQQRKRIKAVVFAGLFVVLLGVLTGLVIAFRDKLAKLWPEEAKAPPASPPQRIVAPTPPLVEPVKPPAKTAVQPPADPIDKKVPVPPVERTYLQEDAAKQVLADAQRLYTELQFEKAQKKFEEAAALDASDRTKRDASDGAKRCSIFTLCTKHIPFAEHATKDIVEVNLGGRALRGVVLRESDAEIVIEAIPENNPASTGRNRLPIPKENLASVPTKIPIAQRQDEFRQFLRKIEGDVPPARGVDYYDVVYVSKRLNLGRECVGYLEKAYRLDEHLDETLRKEVVRRAIERATLFDVAGNARAAKDEMNKLLAQLPDFPLAQQEVEALQAQIERKSKIANYKPTMRMETKKSEVIPGKAAAPAKADADDMGEVVSQDLPQGKAARTLAEADKYEREAKDWGRKWDANRGSREANSWLDKGITAVDKAIELYEKAAREDPTYGDAYRSRAADLGMMRYMMQKSHTVDMRR